MSCSEVSKDEGTVSGAIEALKTNPWLHRTCHGKQDLVQPFDSSFTLRDRPLRLSDTIQAKPENPEFAFLSACHTAVGDKNTPDEIIHLAAGMQFSGFRSIIGTMWAVDDTTAHHMVKEFYDAMFSGKIDCTYAARALNKASKAVDKDKVPTLEYSLQPSFLYLVDTGLHGLMDLLQLRALTLILVQPIHAPKSAIVWM